MNQNPQYVNKDSTNKSIFYLGINFKEFHFFFDFNSFLFHSAISTKKNRFKSVRAEMLGNTANIRITQLEQFK